MTAAALDAPETRTVTVYLDRQPPGTAYTITNDDPVTFGPQHRIYRARPVAAAQQAAPLTDNADTTVAVWVTMRDTVRSLTQATPQP